MAKAIKLFKSFEEQELYFLEYFYKLTPRERLRRLTELQKKMYPGFMTPAVKKITVHKLSNNGY